MSLKIKFLILYTFLVINAILTQGFVYHIPGMYDSWGVVSVTELNDYFLCATSDQYSSSSYSRCTLYNIDKTGNYLKDTSIQFDNNTVLETIHQDKAKHVLTFIGISSDVTNNAFVEYDLTSKSRIEIPFHMKVLGLANDILKIGNSYYFGIFNKQISNVLKIDMDNLKSHASTNLDIAPLDISWTLQGDQIIIKGLTGIELLNSTLDSSLQIHFDIKLGDLTGDIIPIKSRNHYINTGGYILDYITSNGFDSIDLGMSILDENFKTLKLVHIGRPGDTIDIPARSQSISKIENGYYFGGTSNFQIWDYPFGFQPSWFLICKTDSLLNIHWKKEYGGDAYYFMNGIISTSDGGCIAYGSRQDTSSGNFNRDAFMIKLDKEGALVFNKSIKHSGKSEIFLFPNPSKNKIQVRYPNTLDVKYAMVYNINGTEQIKMTINNSNGVFDLNIEKILSGEYFLVLSDEHFNTIAINQFIKI